MSTLWFILRKSFLGIVVVLAMFGSAMVTAMSATISTTLISAASYLAPKLVAGADTLAHRAKASEAKAARAAAREAKVVATSERVTGKIIKRAVLSAERNTSSLMAEVVPVLGTAVIIGVTGWDLVDSCNTIDDMNELRVELGLQKDLSSFADGCTKTKEAFETIKNTIKFK